MRSWARFLFALALLPLGCAPRGDVESPYHRKNGAWRFEDETMTVPPGETVTPLNRAFAKSATVAWYRATPIDGADAASFEALDDHYARDRTQAWEAHLYRRVEEFLLVPHVRLTPLDQVIAPRLKVLGDGYAQDGAHAYYEGKRFEAADPATFVPMEGLTARDRVRGYYLQTVVEGSDGPTFRPMGHDYARDRAAVYYLNAYDADGNRTVIRTADADPGSFQALEYGYGRDAHRAFFQARPISSDVAAFKVLDFGYAKTAAQVFYEGKIVPGADAASFATLAEPTEEASARDRHGLYMDGQRVTPSAAPPPSAH